MILNRKKFAIILFRKNLWRHRFTFCVQFPRKSAIGKSSGWNDKLRLLCFWWQNARKMRPFRRRLAPVLRRAPRVCTGACYLSQRLCVKFRPNRFRVAGVISEKWISYDRNNTPSNHAPVLGPVSIGTSATANRSCQIEQVIQSFYVAINVIRSSIEWVFGTLNAYICQKTTA